MRNINLRCARLCFAALLFILDFRTVPCGAAVPNYGLIAGQPLCFQQSVSDKSVSKKFLAFSGDGNFIAVRIPGDEILIFQKLQPLHEFASLVNFRETCGGAPKNRLQAGGRNPRFGRVDQLQGGNRPFPQGRVDRLEGLGDGK